MQQSHHPRVCFVHIPKCAGTSVTQLFAQIYGEEAFGGLTTINYQTSTAESLSGYRFFAGHNYFRDRLLLPKDTRYFTIVREPTARVISLYRYWGSLDLGVDPHADEVMYEAISIARHLTISQFLSSDNAFVRQEITSALIRQIIPESHYHLSPPEMLSAFSDQLTRGRYAVLTAERLNYTLPIMLERLGLRTDRKLTIENVSSRSELDLTFEQVRSQLFELSPLDYAAYEIGRIHEHQSFGISEKYMREPWSSSED
jgi:hypothetical protein